MRHRSAAATIVSGALIAVTAPAARAQQPVNPAVSTLVEKSAAVKEKNNQPPTGFNVDAGYLYRPKPGAGESRDRYFYDFRLNGDSIGKRGEAFKEPSFADAITLPEKPSDTPDLLLRFDNGSGTAVGPVADYLRLRPFQAKPTSLLGQLRGVAQVYGQLEQRKVSAAVGVELPPINPLAQISGSLRRAGVSNWLIFGIQGAAEGTAGGAGGAASSRQAGGGESPSGTRDIGLVTYRSYLGTGFGYVHSDSSKQVRAAIGAIFDLVDLNSAGALIELVNSDALGKKSDTGPGGGAAADPAATRRKAIQDAVATTLKDLSDEQKAQVKSHLTFLLNFSISARLLKTVPGQPLEPRRYGDATQILESADDWELDAAAFLRRLQDPTSPAGDGYRTLVHRYLRTFFGLEGMPPGGDLPGIIEARNQVRTGNPDEPKTRLATAELLNAALFQITADPSDPTVQEIRQAADLPAPVKAGLALSHPLAPFLSGRVLIQEVYPATFRGFVAVVPAGGTGTNPVWRAKLNAALDDQFLLPDRPTVTVALEGVGQYVAVGKYDGSRFRSLLSPSATFYLNPAADQRNWIRLRYENGRDRTSPTVYRNFFTVTLGYQFN
jgi:hypothetical protein